MYLIHDYSSEMNRVNTSMYELQRSNNKSDETKLWQAIANLQSAIDRKDDVLVDARMQTVEAELEKIALVSNPRISSDRLKYAKEQADAKAELIADAKAAATNTTNTEENLRHY